MAAVDMSVVERARTGATTAAEAPDRYSDKNNTRGSSDKRKAQPSAQATAGRITVRSISSSFLLIGHTEATVCAEEEKANQKGSSYRLAS